MKIVMGTHWYKKLYKMYAFSYMRMFFYIVTIFTVMILPVNLMDNISLCLFYHLFHIKCFACGMTRGIWHMMHFDISGAVLFHPLSFFVFVLLMSLVFLDIYGIVNSLIKMKKRGNIW